MANWTPESRVEEILYDTINGEEYTGLPESRIEELLLELKEVIEAGGGGGGTSTIAWKPTVAADGTISWVRTASETKPEDQNIKGPKGEDGDAGLGIKMVSINLENHLIITFDDDTTQDAGLIPGGAGAVDSVNGKTGDVTLDATDVGALPDDTTIPSKTSDLRNDSNFVADANYVHTDNNYDTTAKSIVDGVVSALADKVDKIPGKGLSTEDYTTAEKTKLRGIATGAEVNVQADFNESDSSSDAYILNKPTLGTAAAKDSTAAVTSGSTDLVESGAVKSAIDAAVSSAYHAAGPKTVAELISSLLVAANEGDVYNMTDAGTTTADFIEGAGKPIRIGDNVGVAKVGNDYKFDLLSGFIDTSAFIEKSVTSGLVKNDGTIDTNSYETATNVSNKANLKLASSGTTASGEIRFGVDGNGNYGYIKAGADSVTPFKNPNGTKSISIAANGTTTHDVEDYANASISVAVTPNLQSKSATASTSQQTISADSGYDGLSSVTIAAATKQSKTVTPTSSQQVITADNGYYGLEQVTVNAAPSANLQVKTTTVTPLRNTTTGQDGTTQSVEISPDSGYDGMSEVNVSTPQLHQYQTMEVAALAGTGITEYYGETQRTTTEKTIIVAPSKVGMSYSGASYLVHSDAVMGNATAADVRQGKTFTSGSGIAQTGSLVVPSTIYGATWAGGSSPAWTRTDAAANFSDPNPYYSGMATTPSSPFDSIMPWAGIRRVTGYPGELVEIPKFWYKWTRSGASMQLQISSQAETGFFVSPAHADRGDGVGERDYVYIGRYKAVQSGAGSSLWSLTGRPPQTNITCENFRQYIHTTSDITWQQDFAMYWTIRMLYLVEFAHWNSQEKIGYGTQATVGTSVNTGYTDSMPYHTGTIYSSKQTYGAGTQYRYIEGMWENASEFYDGIYFDYEDIYVINNPANFGYSGGTKVGTRPANNHGVITSFGDNPTTSGFEYAIFHKTDDGTNVDTGNDTYVTDAIYSVTPQGTGYKNVLYNPVNSHSTRLGLFCAVSSSATPFKETGLGSRLMVLPSAQIT